MRTPFFALLLPLALGCERAMPKGADTTPSDYPSSAKAAKPASAPASQPASTPAATESGKPVTGSVKLVEGQLRPDDVLFVMARRMQDGKAGSLVAVLQKTELKDSSFPLEFELGAAQAMMKDSPFVGPFKIYARLDRDGNPMTKTDDDLYAEIEGPTEAGTTGLELKLRPKTTDRAPPKTAPH